MSKNILVLSDFISNEKIPVAFRLVGNYHTIFHAHDYVEIFYIVNGEIGHKYENEQKTTLSAGDAYIVLPSKKHMFGYGDFSALHRDIMIRASFFREICDFISPSLYDDLLSGKTSCHVRLNRSELNYIESQIGFINQMLLDAIFQKEAEEFVKCFMFTLLSPFISKPIEKHSQSFPVWFKKLLENFTQPELISEGLDAILEGTNYDRKYLCRVFKKNTGLTMTEYLKRTRLDLAISMIQNTDKNILTIAQELGFSSISYFNVSFKERYGITPSQAKKLK